MNYPRTEALGAANLRVNSDYLLQGAEVSDSVDGTLSRRSNKMDRVRARQERDHARGYSINVKLVVLAFAIEFFIIALILVGQVYLVIDTSASQRIVPALLFPLALAIIELARVPLAIGVRTAQSWNIQFAALIGVACAVVVTSVSLYQIGHNTFNLRLENVHTKSSELDDAKNRKQVFEKWKADVDGVLKQKRLERESLAERHNSLTVALNSQPPQICNPSLRRAADGTEIRGQNCSRNPALKTMEPEVADARKKLQAAEIVLAQVEKKFSQDLNSYHNNHEQEVRKFEKEYREAIYQSPLHSYTGMLFGKDAREVSEGEVKTLQRYLIGLPAIAAALASTLVAMTAVRRIRPRDPEPVVNLPDEAAAYLFGPLVTAIKAEANKAVAAAISVAPNATPPPTMSGNSPTAPPGTKAV